MSNSALMKGFQVAEQKREYFRVEFPNIYRPFLVMNNEKFEIEDVSEFGMRFKVDELNLFLVNELIVADIVFPDGNMFELSGNIVRIDNGYVSMELSIPLPLSKIRAEHTYLLKHFLN